MQREKIKRSLWRREQREDSSNQSSGIDKLRNTQNSLHCFPTQITQIILHIAFSYAKFIFVGLEPKKLYVLIAPPTYEDTETSVTGEAKNSVGLCTADSAVQAEPAYLPGTATCASACASEALIHVILLYFTSTVKYYDSKIIFIYWKTRVQHCRIIALY